MDEVLTTVVVWLAKGAAAFVLLMVGLVLAYTAARVISAAIFKSWQESRNRSTEDGEKNEDKVEK